MLLVLAAAAKALDVEESRKIVASVEGTVSAVLDRHHHHQQQQQQQHQDHRSGRGYVFGPQQRRPFRVKLLQPRTSTRYGRSPGGEAGSVITPAAAAAASGDAWDALLVGDDVHSLIHSLRACFKDERMNADCVPGTL